MKPLETLKAGLVSLQQQIKAWKNTLLEHISAKEAISDADEHWLDNDANLVDEKRCLKLLENVLDYEHGLQCLNSQQKTLVEKLKELGGGIKKVVGNKRKRPDEPRKENATLKQKIKIMDWHHKQGKKQKQGHTTAHWDKIYPNLTLKQPLISAWLKDEQRIWQFYADEVAQG
ncbi:hypothetical protein C0993_010722 [Termitomyces sp. T159_Od127]|nr:hypothetical protein C0993_010722 [Termitomyces sp. T159_Od127]